MRFFQRMEIAVEKVLFSPKSDCLAGIFPGKCLESLISRVLVRLSRCREISKECPERVTVSFIGTQFIENQAFRKSCSTNASEKRPQCETIIVSIEPAAELARYAPAVTTPGIGIKALIVRSFQLVGIILQILVRRTLPRREF